MSWPTPLQWREPLTTETNNACFLWISLWRKTGKSVHPAQIDVQQRHLRFGRCHVDYGQNTYIKPFIWTFTLDTNSVLLYAPRSSKSREARARGSSVLTAWPEHCLQLPFLRTLMVPGIVHPTQWACCKSNLCLFSQYEPLRRWHETSGYLEGSTDFRVAGGDKDGKWSLRKVILSMISSSRVYIHIRELPRLSTSSLSYQCFLFCFVFWTTVIITSTKDWKQQENESFWGSTRPPWEKIWMGRLKCPNRCGFHESMLPQLSVFINTEADFMVGFPSATSSQWLI